MSLQRSLRNYSLALLYGFVAVVFIFFSWLKNPRKNIFSVKERPTPPSCLHDPAYGSHGYLTVNGIKIHYVENGDKSKPLMLFLHGFPEFWYSWRYQIKEFSRDYWTVAIDMRGYGDSEKPSGIQNYELKLLTDDVAKVIKALGCDKCILVSHDWGGIIGWNMSEFHPNMIEKYIVMNVPPPWLFRKLLATHTRQFFKSWYMFLFLLPVLPELFLKLDDIAMFERIFKKKSPKRPTVTKEDIEAYKYTFGKAGAITEPLNYYRAFIHGAHSSPMEPQPVEDPPRGLLLFGDQDNSVDIVMVDIVKKTINNLSVQIVKDASHFVQQDEPLIVNRLMRDFLNEK